MAPAPKITRRTLLKTGAAGLAAALGGLGYSTLVEPHRISIDRVTMRLPNLPAGLEGFRIAVLSDFHLYPFTKIEHVREAVQLANGLKPDLTVMLGDFVDATVDAIDELAPALAQLNATHGLFGVLGNHDHWKGETTVLRTLKAHGIGMLQNQGAAITVGQDELFVAGLDSAWAGVPNIDVALRHRRGNPTTLVLVHEPDFADRAARDGRIALQLSGHSHGGQVRLPGIGAPQLPPWGRRYDCGAYQIRDMQVYTNRGIGLCDLPIRFNCPPEVTELTLLRA